MKEYYIHLFEYNDWANKLILEKLKENPEVNSKIFSIFSHIIISQILWLNRVKKETYEFTDFWQMLNLEEMNALYLRCTNDWISFIKKREEENLELLYSYTNSKGIKYSNTLAQIMTHVINHSTYHRAQIATLLREENIQPPLTDYIAFFR
jgi:uncharacterized damage-inducible protein DinB